MAQWGGTSAVLHPVKKYSYSPIYKGRGLRFKVTRQESGHVLQPRPVRFHSPCALGCTLMATATA